MRKSLLLGVLVTLTMAVGCNRNEDTAEENHYSDAAAAGEADNVMPLTADVLLVTRALINGQLYSQPSFEGVPLARFDTAQQIHVLDTTSDIIFVKARIRKDTVVLTGYVSKAILPEE